MKIEMKASNIRRSTHFENLPSANNKFIAPEKIQLRAMTVEDIKDVAIADRLAFPESAWTKTGPRLVEEFYLSHLVRPHPIVHAISGFVDGKCAGFCISGIFEFRTTGFLSENKNLIAKSIAAKPRLLFNPVFSARRRRFTASARAVHR